MPPPSARVELVPEVSSLNPVARRARETVRMAVKKYALRSMPSDEIVTLSDGSRDP